MKARIFNLLEGRLHQRILQTSADTEFWNEESPELQRSLVGPV